MDSSTQPGQILKCAAVRSYPLVERYRLVWIWMADPARIFPIENFNSPDWGLADGGVMPLDCHYLWMADNLLDPSHVAWVHRISFAGGRTYNVSLSVEKHDTGVTVSRWICGEAPSPYDANLVKFEGTCDRLQHYEMNFLAIEVNKTIFTPEGQGVPDLTPEENTFINISYNFMTPIDDARTKYFWFQHRNIDGQDA
ncbi:MAG: aromatic ring-hydroxylating dioxygenase subunit alpha, partial [Alphaproteobacteria bacterium]